MNRIFLLATLLFASIATVPETSLHAQDCETLPCRVDFNKDGCVTIDDIFFLSSPTHPFLNELLDINEDEVVNAVDGQLFICMMNAEACWILGDYDNNGIVSVSDMTTFFVAWGTFNPCVDLTGDGFVTAADLSIFLGQFGQGG